MIELCLNPQQQVPVAYSCYLDHMGFYDCSQIKYIEMEKSESVKLIFKVLSTTQNIVSVVLTSLALIIKKHLYMCYVDIQHIPNANSILSLYLK